MTPSESRLTTDDRCRAAHDLLWDSWRTGQTLPQLPEECRPATRAAGYAIQSLLDGRSRAPIYGWKIAATSTAGQTHIGVDGPLAGRLLKETVLDDGAEISLAGNRMRVAEPEFAFRMADDINPREARYDVDEVLRAVESLHPAIELPDSRFERFTDVGAAQLIADNACAHQFILGPAAPVEWRSLDLARHGVHGSVVGKLERDGTGANALGDPRVALTWLVNELSQLDIVLRAGQIVTTGTCVVPLALAPGDQVNADFGSLGHVSVRVGK